MSSVWRGNWSATRSKGREGRIKLEGRLLPVKEEEDEDTDRDEDVDPSEAADPEFLDAEEIEGGGIQVPSFSTQNTRVNILTKDSKECTVTGFFPLVDPWWSVSVHVKQSGSQYFVQGYPSYKLEDDILGEESILALFLNKCNVHQDFKSEFLSWVKGKPVTFSGLLNLAEDFREEHGKDIVCFLNNSEHGSFALKALKLPLVLRYVPKLLPHKFRSLLKLHAKESSPTKNAPLNQLSDIYTPQDLLLELESILDTEPWKLGFGLLLYEELKLCSFEATLDNFRQCDDLLKKIPDPELNALYIYNDLKKTCMNLGDTYVQQCDLTKTASGTMSNVSAWEALKFLRDKKIVVIEKERVFLSNYYLYEVNAAKFITEVAMKKLQNSMVDMTNVLGGEHTSQKEEKVFCSSMTSQKLVHELSDDQIGKLQINEEENHAAKLDPEQKAAVKMILANPVTIISGKGGCGKTTVVSQVFKALMQKEKDEVEEACKALEDDLDASEEWGFHACTSSPDHSDPICILLTAPTGKAASLLKQKTELPAATLHQITCSYSVWKKQKKKKEEMNEDHTVPWKFSKVEALVVDEGSLVSVRIFSDVLKLLCTHARLQKLVILGDIRQLPSIEPGNLLADIFATFKGINWAIELKTNHRAESQLIVDNATRISKQQGLIFDAMLHFDGNAHPEMPSEEKKCILVSLADESDLSTAIQALLKHGPGLQDHKHSQFIAFRRKDCLLINELCCRHYSGHSMKNSRKRYDFQYGDKVCCTKNAYVRDLQTPSRSLCVDQNNTDPITPSPEKCADDERICNGEIFYIIDDVEREKIRNLTLSDGEERQYTLSYKALRSRSGLNYAWARTIHTFQGSEEDTVVYVLGAAGRQTWKHVYTAVTRGRKRVYIIAENIKLDRAIANKPRERKTRLQQRLKDVLSQNGIWPQSSICASFTQDNFGVASQEHTEFKSPPPSRCPSLPFTPDVASSKKGFNGDSADHPLLSPSGSLNRESPKLEASPSQKRAGVPVDGMETPPKQYRLDHSTNLEEMSPARALQKLNLNGSCNKQLFNFQS